MLITMLLVETNNLTVTKKMINLYSSIRRSIKKV